MKKPFKLMRVMSAVYLEPWLIRPEMHSQISRIVQAHVDGTAHVEGIMDLVESDKPEYCVMDGVAIIPVKGVIGQGVSQIEKSSGMCDVNDVEDMLDLAMADESISAIMLDIDSPGGTVSGTPELASKISAIRETKPVISYANGMEASAAYWIGSQATASFASESATVGSIGVYLPILDSSRAMEMQGLKMELFKAGKFKGAGVQGTSLSDDQKAMFQSRVDHIHGMFKASVRDGRGRNIADEDMEGQDFIGSQAVDNGLVDGIATRKEVIEIAKKLAQIKE